MPETRQLPRLDIRHVIGLTHRERIDWHYHTVHQLITPIHGVLQVSTPLGVWVVPPQRAVWIPAGVEHAHRAHGPTQMRSLVFEPARNPLRLDRPTVLAAEPLLREVIVTLTDEPDLPVRQRRNLERVALDRLRTVRELPLCLPAPADDRLRALTQLLHADPADARTLAELGRAVGAGERTLSRLFRQQTGMTFPQWRGRLRLQHALTLLAAGTAVTPAAAACGYRSPSAFIEAFRDAYGTTPGRYQSELSG
jgi:AraC-like DNA-binding protein